QRFARSATTSAVIRTTAAATMIAGGIKENQLAGEARATVHFRILPGDSVALVVRHVRAAIADPAVEIRQVGRAYEPSPVADVESESYAVLARTIEAVFPDVLVAPSLVVPGTDSVHLVRLAENSYRFLPMRVGEAELASIHGMNERLAVKNYAEIIRFYAELLRNAALGAGVTAPASLGGWRGRPSRAIDPMSSGDCRGRRWRRAAGGQREAGGAHAGSRRR